MARPRERLREDDGVSDAVSYLRDLVGLVSVASIAYGAWEIYPPLGFIAAGAFGLLGVVIHIKARGG